MNPAPAVAVNPTAPAAVPVQQVAQPALASLALPSRRNKNAPEKFKGKYNEVKRFLRHYERLCHQHQITVPQELCENVTLYCSSHITRLIEILPSYRNHDWIQLKADFLSFFDADQDAKRYKVRSLVTFVSKCRSTSIRSLSDWKKYTREFIAIGGWLLAKNKISSNDYATYFWKGIPQSLCIKIESRLLAPMPLRDMTTPFSFDEVSQAAEKILQRDRFDTDLVYSDTEGSDSNDSDSSDDTGSDTDASTDSEEEHAKRAKHSKRAKYKHTLPMHKSSLRKTRFEEEYSSDDEESPSMKTRKAVQKERTTRVNPKEEVENLIQQLGQMHIGDANYGTLYYKAITLDPVVRKIIESPLERAAKERSMGLRDPQFPSARLPTNNRSTTSNTNQVPRPAPNYNPYPRGTACFGCGDATHGLVGCPKIAELLTKGALRKTEGGLIVLPGGIPLRRWGEETLISAYEKWVQTEARTHFIKWEDDG
ncbi:hypothetical protein EDB19DRAFT_1638252 [Suillus lakei]|nr:hypothetical protein EDB19DRAFT_1638252 [Suillus lakei]